MHVHVHVHVFHTCIPLAWNSLKTLLVLRRGFQWVCVPPRLNVGEPQLQDLREGGREEGREGGREGGSGSEGRQRERYVRVHIHCTWHVLL